MVFIRLCMYFIWILRYFLDSESIWKKSKFIKGPTDFRSKMIKRCFFLNKYQSWYFDCQIVILKCVHLNSINSYWPWEMHKQVSSALHDMHQPILYLLLKISICIKSINSCLSVKNLVHFWKNKYLAIFLYQKEKNYFFFLSFNKKFKGQKKKPQQIKQKLLHNSAK